MGISERTQKLLWTRSGGRYAYCRRELISDPADTGEDCVVGVQAHICSAKPNGPRKDPALPPERADDYDNLILLCMECHKSIDDNPDKWPAERLRELRDEHERQVDRAMRAAFEDSTQERLTRVLDRMVDGAQIMDLQSRSMAYDLGHSPLSTEGKVELVAGFLQDCEDYQQLKHDLPSGGRVRAAHDLSRLIRALEDEDLLVFGGTYPYSVPFGGNMEPIVVCMIRVLRSDDPRIRSDVPEADE